MRNLQKQISDDSELPMIEKIELINGIEYWQKERWKRLRNWWNIEKLPINVKHMFVKKEIDLIRSQEVRLKAIKQSVYG